MSKQINIGGRLHSTEQGNVITGANEVIDDTKGKKQNVINADVDAELLRLDQSKQNNLTFDNTPTENSNNPVKSGGVYAADKALSDAIEAILILIPSAATALNQLADKNFVNSSIATDTATFRGTSETGLTEAQFLEWANGLTHDMNDYVFWQTIDEAGNTLFKRYKWNGTQWLYEYALNNSSFTADQWAAIMSGITAALVGKLRDLPTAEQLITSFNGKQDVLTFDNTPTQGSANPVKSGGVFSAIKDVTDLIPAEATNLNQLADKAYVLAQILAATPAFKGQFETLVELQAVQSPKAGDLGIVRTKDSDGYDVFTFYQYLNNQWNVFYILAHHLLNKPATTGTRGDYPYNGMGRVVIPKKIVNGVNTLTQDAFEDSEGNDRENTIYVIQYDFTLGEDITIPANCVLEFAGGSINHGRINLSSNCSVIGNGAVCEASCNIYNLQQPTPQGVTTAFFHRTLFAAENASNISIKDITIKGQYTGEFFTDNSVSGVNDMGYAMLYFYNCQDIILDKVEIIDFANSPDRFESVSWDDVYKSNVDRGAVKFVFCEDLAITDCKERNSSGEAWCFSWCKSISMNFCSFIGTYKTSYLHFVYCDGMVIVNNEFVKKKYGNGVLMEGDSVNLPSSNYIFANNYIENGYVDFGNEVANVDLTMPDGSRNQDYQIIGAKITNNTFYHAKVWDSTKGNVPNDSCIVKDVLIANNNFVIDAKPSFVCCFGTLPASRIEVLNFKNNVISIDGNYDVALNPAIRRYQILDTFNSYVKNANFDGNTFIDNIFTGHADDLIPASPRSVLCLGNIDILDIRSNIITAPYIFDTNNLKEYKDIRFINNVFKSDKSISLSVAKLDNIAFIGNDFDMSAVYYESGNAKPFIDTGSYALNSLRLIDNEYHTSVFSSVFAASLNYLVRKELKNISIQVTPQSTETSVLYDFAAGNYVAGNLMFKSGKGLPFWYDGTQFVTANGIKEDEAISNNLIIPASGKVTVNMGYGLFLVRMDRNGLSTIVENSFSGINPIEDTYTVNNAYISFSKPGNGAAFEVNDITGGGTDAQRTIRIKKLW